MALNFRRRAFSAPESLENAVVENGQSKEQRRLALNPPVSNTESNYEHTPVHTDGMALSH